MDDKEKLQKILTCPSCGRQMNVVDHEIMGEHFMEFHCFACNRTFELIAQDFLDQALVMRRDYGRRVHLLSAEIKRLNRKICEMSQDAN